MNKQIIHTNTPDSTRISSISYNPDTEDMVVTFAKGGVYKYQNISTEVHSRIIGAPSVGKEFQKQIISKLDKIPYEKLARHPWK